MKVDRGLGSGYWHAMFRLDRPLGLAELERAFAEGEAPRDLDGPIRGRLVATTIGHGVDRPAELLARAWMPWKGKTFAPATGGGRNLFTRGGDRAIGLAFRGYVGGGSDATGPTAFRFATSVGPSATHPEVDVLRIDYDLAENPAWPVRKVLDELVAVGDGIYLGQALLNWRGSLRRAAWFSLER